MEPRNKNQAAYRQMKQELAERYPAGWFVAFDDGEIVADAATFDDLIEALAAIGKDRPDVLAVQAGVNYPEEVFILI
jgi:hypothetical protein